MGFFIFVHINKVQHFGKVKWQSISPSCEIWGYFIYLHSVIIIHM